MLCRHPFTHVRRKKLRMHARKGFSILLAPIVSDIHTSFSCLAYIVQSHGLLPGGVGTHGQSMTIPVVRRPQDSKTPSQQSLSEGVYLGAPSGTRTPDTRIKSPLL